MKKISKRPFSFMKNKCTLTSEYNCPVGVWEIAKGTEVGVERTREHTHYFHLGRKIIKYWHQQKIR